INIRAMHCPCVCGVCVGNASFGVPAYCRGKRPAQSRYAYVNEYSALWQFARMSALYSLAQLQDDLCLPIAERPCRIAAVHGMAYAQRWRHAGQLPGLGADGGNIDLL